MLGFALVGFGIANLAGLGPRPRRQDGAARPPAASAELPPMRPDAALARLLGGLDVGSSVAGWKVITFYPPAGGAARVVLERAGRRQAVEIKRKGSTAHRAPAASERWEVFFVTGPAGTSDSSDALKPLLDALAAELRRHEHEVPPPPWAESPASSSASRSAQ